MTIKEYKDIVAGLYKVNSVKLGYDYWIHTLTEKCLGMFTYTGLPESLPSEELELRIISCGYACVFKDSGELVTSFGGLSGQDKYYKPKFFVYSQPALSGGTKTIHVDCAIIYNSEIDGFDNTGLSTLIKRYARLLADIESSLDISIVNSRTTNIGVAKTESIAKSFDALMTKIQAGDISCVNENTILDCFKTLPMNDTKNSFIPDLLVARDSILRAFYSEIGIKSAMQKRERLLTDEITAENQLLIINLKDMLNQRKKGVDEMNQLFNLNVTVEISPEYDPNIILGVTDNDNI